MALTASRLVDGPWRNWRRIEETRSDRADETEKRREREKKDAYSAVATDDLVPWVSIEGRKPRRSARCWRDAKEKTRREEERKQDSLSQTNEPRRAHHDRMIG